jgi:hypothetical protein
MTTDLATDSTTGYLKLRTAIDTAIQTFSKALNPSSDEKYVKIITELSGKIDEVRTEINATLVVPKTGKKKSEVKKLEPESASQQMSIVDVNKFITKHETDAIFVVTGGSFNPPHNGHIGMFQKAYDALIKKFPGKKVYGVMVPAEDSWIEGKLHKAGEADIESKRIKVVERVNLCKLSCDNFEWTDTQFNASNMIVVNQSAQGEDFTKKTNTYYLCGSDYYATSGGGPYKFICVLRKGVELLDTTPKQLKFDKPPIADKLKTDFDVKDDDIIVEGGGDDSEASSTMLRNILTKIRDAIDYDAEEPIKTKLLTKQVYCELLNMKYIVGDKGKDIANSLKCSELDIRDDTDDSDDKDTDDKDTDDKDIIPMKLTGNKDGPNKDKFIKDLVDSFVKRNNSISVPADKSSFTSDVVKEALDNVYDRGHYMLLNDIHFMNKKSSGQPLIFQLMNKNHLLAYVASENFDMDGEKVYDSYKREFGKLSDKLKPEYETLCKFLFETERTAILFQILRISEGDGEARMFAGIMKDFYDNLLTKESDTRDGILGAVGYTFKSAYGDGNCFYNSAGMQLIDPVVDYIVYDKLARNEEWQRTQLEKQTRLRTDLTAYLKKLYNKLNTHSDFATSENITIKYLRTNGPNFQNVSTIRSGIGSQFWGTDDELYFIAALYDCFIAILPSNDTNFQTIEYTEKIDSDEVNQDKLFKALSAPSIPILSHDELIAKLGEVTRAKKQIIFMLGGKGHWDYAIPILTK